MGGGGLGMGSDNQGHAVTIFFLGGGGGGGGLRLEYNNLKWLSRRTYFTPKFYRAAY